MNVHVCVGLNTFYVLCDFVSFWKVKPPTQLERAVLALKCVYRHAKMEPAYVSPVGRSVQLSSMSSEVCTNEFDTSRLLARARPRVFYVSRRTWAEEICVLFFFPFLCSPFLWASSVNTKSFLLRRRFRFARRSRRETRFCLHIPFK